MRSFNGSCTLLGLLIALAFTQVGSASPSSAPSGAGRPSKDGRVATNDTRPARGLFTVQRRADRVLFEIPSSLLDKDMLWYSELAAVPSYLELEDFTVATRVVRWERRGNKIFLRDLSFNKRADKPHGDILSGPEGKDEFGPVRLALAEASLSPIIMAFDVKRESKGRSVTIDVTELLKTEVPEFSPRPLLTQAGLSLAALDVRRSYVEEVQSYPTGIHARSLLTYALHPDKPAPEGAGSVSLAIHHNLLLLPEQQMRPRYADPRVGYFTVDFDAYGGKEERVIRREFIQRFRLEKQDPDAAVSDPVKPIVYYISREVPDRWRPYIKRGVEDWNIAFRAAGFSNAIGCRDAPTPEEDPHWSPDDPRCSVIRWSAQAVSNAMGPAVQDPRSGEILAAKIVLLADVLKIAQFWYFAQCSGVDPRARKFPLPEELTGELLRCIVAHEVGHTLGLQHNFKASSAFTVKQLRDPTFTDRYGTVASIMSYGRFNYVTQPGDGVKRLLPKVGPYDLFAISWGYRPIREARSPGDERKTLDQWAARQITEPWLRFGGEEPAALFDPSIRTESIGADPVQSTALGLQNLNRALDYLVPATTRLGDDRELLDDVYDELLTQRKMWLWSVMKMVGGAVELRRQGGRGGDRSLSVPRAKQREAVQFLLGHAFTTPRKFLQPPLSNRFRLAGAADPVKEQQRELLLALLLPARYRLLSDEVGESPSQAYPLAEFLRDVQYGLWSELGTPRPRVDPYRRELQRLYLSRLRSQLSGSGRDKESEDDPVGDVAAFEDVEAYDDIDHYLSVRVEDTDFPAVARSVLQELNRRIAAAIRRTKDPMTMAHLKRCRNELARMLREE